jgi:hypothetical protein
MLGQHGIVATGARAALRNFLEAGACRLALRILVHFLIESFTPRKPSPNRLTVVLVGKGAQGIDLRVC